MKKVKMGRPIKGTAKTVTVSVTMDPQMVKDLRKILKGENRSEWICDAVKLKGRGVVGG